MDERTDGAEALIDGSADDAAEIGLGGTELERTTTDEGAKGGSAAQGPSRRAVLKGGMAGAIAASLFGERRLSAQVGTGPFATPDPELLLFKRATCGFNEAQYVAAKQAGYQNWLNAQLAYDTLPQDIVLQNHLNQLPSLDMTPAEMLMYYAGNQFAAKSEVRAGDYVRRVLSNAQLYERCVELWNDHLSIWIDTDGEYLHYSTYQRDVIRAHGLENYSGLIHASSESSAMSLYLNQFQSRKGTPNENYSRELTELHTLGVDGGYTEVDVIELARILTGWVFETDADDPDREYGEFFFEQDFHDTDDKTLLGVLFTDNGQQEGIDAIDLLLSKIAALRFAATKIARHFVAYDPPASVVNDIAIQAFVHNWDLRSMVGKALSENLLTTHAEPKLLRPYHYATWLIRAIDADLTDLGLFTYLKRMGQHIFDRPSPDGYPDSLEHWGRDMLPRWEFADDFFHDRIDGLGVPDAKVLALFGTTPKWQLAQRANDALTGGTIPMGEQSRIQAYLSSLPGLTVLHRRIALALTASTPSFQFF